MRRSLEWEMCALFALVLIPGLLHGCSKSKPANNQNRPSDINANRSKASAALNDTAYFFDDDLAISVTHTEYNRSLRVFATIESPGWPPKKLEDAEVGSTTEYEGKDKYKIKIMTGEKSKVWFDVTRELKDHPQ